MEDTHELCGTLGRDVVYVQAVEESCYIGWRRVTILLGDKFSSIESAIVSPIEWYELLHISIDETDIIPGGYCEDK